MQDTAEPSSETASRPPSNAWREYRALKRLVLVAIGVSCAVSLSMNLADPDLWGHVRYGQDLLAEGELPATATHTFTAVDHPWVNHENLAEIAFAVVYGQFGDEGLLVFKCLWGLAILGLMVWIARRQQIGSIAIAAMMMLVASNLAAFFPVRPQLLSYMWLALSLVAMHLSFEGWHSWLDSQDDRRSCPGNGLLWLLALPALMIGWTNSHGAFAAGVAITGVYLGGRIVEAIVARRYQSRGVVAWIAFIGGLVLASTLVNPYGWGLHQWMLSSLGSPRPEITEWAPPKFSDPVFVPLVLMTLTTVGSLALSRRRRDWVQIVVLAFLFWQACSHVRHISLLSILVGFWLPVHFADAAARLRPNTSSMPTIQLGRVLRWIAAGGLAVAIALQSSVLYFKVARLPVYRHMYPIDAITFMAEEEMQGRLVVSFNWAQYALAALSPDVTVSFDGRFRTCYPQQVIDENFDFLLGENKGRRFRSEQSGDVDGQRVLNRGNPSLVLVDRNYENAVENMQSAASESDSEWTLLYQDGIAQLWGRSSEFDNPSNPNYLPPAERLISDHRSETAVDWPAFPHRERPLVKRSVASPSQSPSL